MSGVSSGRVTVNREALFAAFCNAAPPMDPGFPIHGLLPEMTKESVNMVEIVAAWEADGAVIPARLSALKEEPGRTRAFAIGEWWEQQRINRQAYNRALRAAAEPDWRVHWANKMMEAYDRQVQL